MKNLEYYKKLKYKMAIEFIPEDNFYFARFPELPGCIAHGESPEIAARNAMIIKDEWLATALEAGWDIPEPTMPVDISGRITVRTPKSLHQRLVERAQQEGISLNQLILTYLAEGIERKIAEKAINEAATALRTAALRAKMHVLTNAVKSESVQYFSLSDQWSQLKMIGGRVGSYQIDEWTERPLLGTCSPGAYRGRPVGEEELQGASDDDIDICKR